VISAERSLSVRPVHAVVFDWYATLGHPLDADGWWGQMRHLISRHGGTVDEAAILLWQALPIDHVASSTSKDSYDAWIDERFRGLLRACSVREEQIEAIVCECASIRAEEFVSLLDGARATVDALHDAGFLVAVCSNWDWDLDRHLAHNGIKDSFDLVVCSALVGYRKPHRAIFELVTEGLGVDPASIVFVGDDLEADIAGATAARMRPVHAAWAIDCAGGHPDTVVCCATFDELLALPELAVVRDRGASVVPG
jgi:HAD superfamily hydrolase (TIGR01509 family)